jgi:cyclopropane fatty-acyl-phospholipid synthase-like methyltransferase
VKRDFGGEAARYYHRYRHGYPSAVTDALVRAFKLTGQDITVDLGCGTGQLALPMARYVRAVIGVDVEPDMLDFARQAARDADVHNVIWVLGAFDVVTTAVDYVATLDMDQLVGGIYSAMGSRMPASGQRPAFAEQVRAALAPHDRFCERVHVAMVIGTG